VQIAIEQFPPILLTKPSDYGRLSGDEVYQVCQKARWRVFVDREGEQWKRRFGIDVRKSITLKDLIEVADPLDLSPSGFVFPLQGARICALSKRE
jgi:hypothetical protein